MLDDTYWMITKYIYTELFKIINQKFYFYADTYEQK